MHNPIPNLTAEEIAARRSYIGASDAKRVMDGDWFALWQEKTGATTVDLSDVFPVQLGLFTEPINLYWLDRTTAFAVRRPDQAVYRLELASHVAARPDAIAIAPNGEELVVEAKHVGGFEKPETVLERYWWQLQHQMLVTGYRKALLSVIAGNRFLDPVPVAADDEAHAMMLERYDAFWRHVIDGTPPVHEVEAAAGGPKPEPDAPTKAVDLSRHNGWASLAVTYADDAAAAKRFKEAEAGLKELVPGDARLAYGHGIVAKRDKAGRLKLAAGAVTGRDLKGLTVITYGIEEDALADL